MKLFFLTMFICWMSGLTVGVVGERWRINSQVDAIVATDSTCRCQATGDCQCVNCACDNLKF